MLIVGALEEVVSNCLGGDSPVVWADWCLGMAYTKEVLVKWVDTRANTLWSAQGICAGL